MNRPSLNHLPGAGALIAAVLLAGCGISNPYTSTSGRPASTSTVASATATNPIPVHERNATIPAAANTTLAANAGDSSETAALIRYTRAYVNWTAKTVAAVQKHLAAVSLDGARAEALQAAASYGADSTLQTSKLSNSGSVISIAKGQGPASGQWVVVTREQTHGSGNYVGLPASDHVYLAGLTHTATGWVISSWTPQS